jgi:signal transduction histidine kinase
MAHKLTLRSRKAKIVPSIPAWRRAISGVRPRLLVWYFLLTTATTLVSLHATRQIFYERLQTRSQDAVRQQAEQFTLMVDKNRLKGSNGAQTLPVLFSRLLSNYAPIHNEYVLMFIGDRLYKTSSALPQNFISAETIKAWRQDGHPARGSVRTPDGRLFNYAIETATLGGETGYVVAIQNASAEFEMVDQSLDRITQVALVVLALCLFIAWIMTGKILDPLKLLTKTAQSITESDMHQRLKIRGHDEIAELGETFNEMLDRLQEAFDSQKEFIKDASHELRTPITVIQGHLEMLKYSTTPTEDTIALLMDELERMARLVNDLLTLAKADHPDFLHPKPEELDWLTEEVYLKARSFSCDRQWKLESKGLSPITVDRQRLTQAMMNLVQNAIRHTRSHDTITLGSAVKENYAYLWVRDTGEGIAPEDQARIFERFARAAQPDQEGHGLGLAIVNAIVVAHGGWVELESRLGHGSTFTLLIPLMPLEDLYEPDSDRRGQPAHQRLLGNWASGPRLQPHDRANRQSRDTSSQ